MEDERLIGIYWGAFDPPTQAHIAIIKTALQKIDLQKLFIVVNNHSYKNYNLTLEKRFELLSKALKAIPSEKILLLWQDDEHPINYSFLRKFSTQPLCAISGYDSYKKWVACSNKQGRYLYQKIAVVPRGDEEPLLFDAHAFLLEIDPTYRHVSSSKERERCFKEEIIANAASERIATIK